MMNQIADTCMESLCELSSSLNREDWEMIDFLQNKDLDKNRNCDPFEVYKFHSLDLMRFPTVAVPFENATPVCRLIDTCDLGDQVLDVGTGTGILGLLAAKKGSNVVATDINPTAVKIANCNALHLGCYDRFHAYIANIVEPGLSAGKYDTVIANLPFRNKASGGYTTQAFWDDNFDSHRRLFGLLNNIMKPNGRLLLAQANFGDLDAVKHLIQLNSMVVKRFEKHEMPNDPRIFYGMELSF